MNEQELGKEIAKLLDYSADENIKQSTLYRLQSARRAALQNSQSTLEIMNSGNNTSVFGEHDEHFNTGKLLLLVLALFAFTLVSATYWQFLEKSKSTVDTTILADDLSTETYFDNESDLTDDLLTETYSDGESDLTDSNPTEARIYDESKLSNDVPTEARIDHESERVDDMPIDARIDNELDEWFDSNK